MPGRVEALNALKALLHGQAPRIDLLGLADHPGDGAQPARHAQGARVGESGQPPLEHLGIEFVGLAVHIHIGAWKMGAHEDGAQLRRRPEELVHKGVFGPAQGQRVKLRSGDEGGGIGSAGMGRGENQRPRSKARTNHLERRIQLRLKRRSRQLWPDRV